MIKNALNRVQSDSLILKIITQQELQKLKRSLLKKFQVDIELKDIKFQVKLRGIHKIEKKNSIGISISGYENKEKYPIYVSQKCCEEKRFDLLVIGEEGKRHYVLIKDINTFIYDHTLHHEKKFFFCIYFLEAFSTEEILKHIKNYFDINGKQRIIIPKKRRMP